MNWLALFSLCCAAAFAILFASMLVAARRARDPVRTAEAPPAFWRWFAWPIGVFALWPGALVSPRYRFRLNERLRSAGLAGRLTAERFIGAQCLSATMAGAVGFGMSRLVGSDPAAGCMVCAVGGLLVPATWLRDLIQSRRRRIHRDLPFFLDVLTLAVEAGLNLNSALVQAVDRGPGGPLKWEFELVLHDLRAGRPRAEALRLCATRLAEPGIHNLVGALLSADRSGASLGPVLRAQSGQRRAERFARAEKAAMQAPVKMLFPLVMFIFPGTFAIIFFPLASRFLAEGWLR